MNVSSLTKILDINSEYLGISRELLMENAGKEIAQEVEKKNFHSIAIFCGTGNNGGDGFVAARHLASLGKKKVKVFSLAGKRTKEAQKNFDILKNLPSIEIFEIKDSSDVSKIKEEIERFDVIIDALIGVGIRGELREPIKSLVEIINLLKVFKISTDVPTPRLKPDLVISFHTPKTENAKVVSIGIPKEAELFSGPGDVYYTLPKRTGDEHKSDFGKLLVIGGSKNFIGTPWLVAQSALRAGIDLTLIACPKYVAERIPYDPNLIINPLPSKNYLKIEDLEQIRKITFDSVVIGNGLGTENETKHFVRRFLKEMEKPVILDADALKLIEPRHLRENTIITPHAGEFKNLFGEFSEEFQERVALVEKFARKYGNMTIVLKGPIDIISNGEQTKLNKTGNAGMTVGGTGDVLAGVIAALTINKETENFYACSAASFLTGLSGDLAKEEFGYYFNATDVIEKIPDAIKFCKEKFW